MTKKPFRVQARDAALTLVRGAGAFRFMRQSRWRGERLLILCYHGFSQQDESTWNPHLYVSGDHFESRLQHLLDNQYAVLPLTEGLDRMAAGTLPPRAVAITVDDGAYDFLAVAYPILRRLGIPATVFVATYHVFDRRPVFDVAFRYLMWKVLAGGAEIVEMPTAEVPLPIGSELEYSRVTEQIVQTARREHWSAEKKHEWMREFAVANGIDWEQFLQDRLLGLMYPEEIRGLDPTIADIQLHTHRHRVPEDRQLFLREIEDNRKALAECGCDPGRLVQFCYPSGVHRPAFLGWLSEAGVTAAVTGTPGLACRASHPLLLPRFIDASTTSAIEFDAWISGFRHFAKRPTRDFGIDP